ncbi:cytochrome d ubiquinol oxidase subunit II [Gulosibacter macacae]|uniref:Cytochrome d ubiquinol oxidase subunit II n=1 Tax=Gulosibacter macacae TaxID=2488791 RepID=A0A3P3W2M3_9MICO|nr:cytochrome d ubiquinol oxidase subunit II [Gulosibacter macacae]RRJ87899.1 cytochrome d ubiquinol oxidase subunit II [Gulosibacter macacae]
MDLQILWFWIVGFLFIGYFVLDGFDFGVGIALPFVGKDDTDRRVLINTIGPIWDLNETWVIVAGACLFAAFPEWYGTIFAGAYLALFVILIALIVRGVSFEYRHQGKGVQWTRWFDGMIFWGSAIPALLWGVAFANIVRGMPMVEAVAGGTNVTGELTFHYNYSGTFFDLLNFYSLLGGLTTLALFFYHGLVFITRKTDGELQQRAKRLATLVGVAVAVLAIAFLGWTVIAYFSVPTLVLCLIAVLAFVASWVANLMGKDGAAFGFGVVTIIGAVGGLFSTLFFSHGGEHMLMKNLIEGGRDMTIYSGSASQTTLEIMSWAFLFIMPFVIAYQAWSFWTFRKRLRRDDFIAEAESPAVEHVGA